MSKEERIVNELTKGEKVRSTKSIVIRLSVVFTILCIIVSMAIYLIYKDINVVFKALPFLLAIVVFCTGLTVFRNRFMQNVLSGNYEAHVAKVSGKDIVEYYTYRDGKRHRERRYEIRLSFDNGISYSREVSKSRYDEIDIDSYVTMIMACGHEEMILGDWS